MPELTWIGKEKVINHHHDVPFRVLERKYSYDSAGEHTEDNGSENMIIHGDNLEALKALLPKFEGKVDCIYIDPPYNTGNESWVYNDNVNDPRIKKWLGQVVGKKGEDLSRHDKWLCMMYPRLKLLYMLLSDKGIIFISIDDQELFNLKLIADEIFGASNYISTLAIGNNLKGRSDQQYFATSHEYLLAYKKGNGPKFTGFDPDEKIIKRYNKIDSNGRKYREIDLRKTGSNDRRIDRPNMYYPFYWDEKKKSLSLERTSSSEIEIFPQKSDEEDGCWRWGKDTASSKLDSLFARFMPNKHQWSIFEKDYLDSRGKVKPTTLWLQKEVNTERGSEQIQELFGDKREFDFPKPVGYLELLLGLVVPENGIFLDSFAGSGTTGHAIINLNEQDGINRKFILIEMMDYADEITSSRIKKVIQGYAGHPNKKGSFSFFELGSPVFVDGLINNEISINQLKDYIWYSETQSHNRPESDELNPYFLGSINSASYHFIYEPNQIAYLDNTYLNLLQDYMLSASNIIYADACLLSQQQLRRLNITFKKIPRDITRL